MVQLAPFGYLAVDLFFMMSGFVIARTYEPRIAQGLSWPRFAILRLLRLYPVLVLGVLAGALVSASGYAGGSVEDTLRALLLFPNLASRVLFPTNAVLWSLLFELVLNFGHAAVAGYLTRGRVLAATSACGVAYAYSIWRYHGAGLGWDGHTFIAGFARAGWGYGVGVALNRVSARPSLPMAWSILAAALGLLLAPNFGFSALRVLGTVFVVLPLATASAVSLTKFRYSRIATWLGGLSYPLYGVHLPLITATSLVFGRLSSLWWAVVAVSVV